MKTGEHMRRFSFALGCFCLLETCTAAQMPGVDAKVDEILTRWERAMEGVNSVVVADCSRLTTKKIWNSTQEFLGEAKFVKSTSPNKGFQASLALHKKDRQDVMEQFVCTGSHIFMYDPANRTIYFTDQP